MEKVPFRWPRAVAYGTQACFVCSPPFLGPTGSYLGCTQCLRMILSMPAQFRPAIASMYSL